MSKKIMWLDTETTGLDAVQNGIIQIAMIMEIDGRIEGEKVWNVKPFPEDKIEVEALAVSGNTIESISQYQEPEEVHREVVSFLAEHISKFDKFDKAYPAGYNVGFDVDFMANWFRKNNDKYFGSWQNWRKIDPLPLLYMMDLNSVINLKNYKLETVCEHFGINVDAHDALEDVRATIKVYRELEKLIII